MNGALWAKELGERFDDMFLEGANVSKIWARLQGGRGLRKPVALSYSIVASMFTKDVRDHAHKRGQPVTYYQNC
jgi:hypothetical protein